MTSRTTPSRRLAVHAIVTCAAALLVAGCAAVLGADFDRPAADGPANVGAPSSEDGGCAAACASPPPSTCTDAKTLRAYVAQGTCVAGTCSYARYAVECATGCVNGACIGDDPCNGITCVTPPTAACADGGAVEIYSAEGTCAAGACRYASSATSCSDGCANGQCVVANDTCAGITCTQPPLPTCVDTVTLETFTPAGTCTSGKCSYAPTDTECPRPIHATTMCSTGACDFMCDTGYQRSGFGCAPIGSGWVAVSSGAPGLWCVWGTGPSNVYAAGTSGWIVHATTPSAWTAQLAPTTETLLGMWGSSASDIYVVGTAGAIFHSNGAGTWTGQSSGSGQTLDAVWGSGSGDVYAVGAGGLVLHSTGAGDWTKQTTGTTSELQAIWGSGAGDVYAISVDGAILHSTGAGVWTPQSTGTNAALFGIWGSGSGDIYVVGTESVHSAGGGVWNAFSPGTALTLYAAWGSGAGDVYGVGEAGTIVHLSGGAWSLEPSGVPSTAIYGIWGSSSTDIYIAVADGTVLHGP